MYKTIETLVTSVTFVRPFLRVNATHMFLQILLPSKCLVAMITCKQFLLDIVNLLVSRKVPMSSECHITFQTFEILIFFVGLFMPLALMFKLKGLVANTATKWPQF